MKNFLVMFFLIAALFAFAQDSRSKLVFSNLGFSIQALEGNKSSSNYVALTMSLPETDNFSPNINLMIQEYNDTMDSYKDVSETQLKSMNLKIINSAINNNIYSIEYSGNLQGNDLHFYAKAAKRDKQVFLTTAACTPAQWEIYSKKLIEIVDSFKLE